MGIFRIIASTVLALAALPCWGGPSLSIETIDGPPWGFVGADGAPTGMMYDISNRIAQEAGFSFTNRLTPYARTGTDIEHGKADFVLRFGSAEMAHAAIPVVVVVSMPVIALGLKGTHFSALEDLHGKTVGIVRSSKYTDKFDFDLDIRKYDADNYLQIVRMLRMNRLDAGVGASAGLFYSARMAGVKSEELGTPLVIGYNDFVLHFSKKNADPATMDALRQAVKRLNQRGEVRKIINSYVGEYQMEFGPSP